MQIGSSIFRCPMCRTPTPVDPQHATLVVDGEPVCHRITCIERATALLQGRELSDQLGIGFKPEAFQLPLRLGET